jgi:hypothetical protein
VFVNSLCVLLSISNLAFSGAGAIKLRAGDNGAVDIPAAQSGMRQENTRRVCQRVQVTGRRNSVLECRYVRIERTEEAEAQDTNEPTTADASESATISTGLTAETVQPAPAVRAESATISTEVTTEAVQPAPVVRAESTATTRRVCQRVQVTGRRNSVLECRYVRVDVEED